MFKMLNIKSLLMVKQKHIDGTSNNGKWFATWENGGLLAWNDRNGDGKIQYASGAAFDGKGGKPAFDGDNRAEDGHKLTTNGKR